MGCSTSITRGFIVKYCNLKPVLGKENTYIIELIAEEKLKKIDGLKLLDQCGQNNELKIKEFLDNENFKDTSIFYYFLREKPIIKTYYQSLKYHPFSLPKLFQIIILSTAQLENIPIQLIEKQTKNLLYNEFIGKELNLNEMKKKIDEANNSNITKDSMSLSDDIEYEENETIKEKDNEIIICGELNKETLDNIIFKFNNIGSIYNKDLIIAKNDENENENENIDIRKNINIIKIFSSSFDNISLFDKLMKFLKDKNIKKFYFYDNNINIDFDGWNSICEFLENDYNIRYVDLHCSSLSDNNINSLIAPLSDKRIRYLNLSENFLSVDGIKIISSFLKENKTLQRLILRRNSKSEFKAEGVKIILESLDSSKNIEFIDFSYMNLTGCGAHIGNFLNSNKSLEKLILINVQLNAADFKNIFWSVKTNNIIKEIDVSLNDMGGDKSLQYIADGVKENKSLNCLKMDKININNDNYQIIFDAIEQNKKITHYTVNYNSKIKPKIMLNFFMKQTHVKTLEYEPYDKTNDEDKNKELTLEEKKLFEKFKTERPDMELIYK